MSTHRRWKSSPLPAREPRLAGAGRRPALLGFTLIELLVVVAIIALLLSILLPSLRSAREQARAVVCGQQLRDFGTGGHVYFNDNNDWIPGINTSGVALACVNGIPGAFYDPRLPVQTYDWITPIRTQGMELPASREKRFREIMNKFLCPSQRQYGTVFYTAGLNACMDKQEFLDEPDGWTALSYLMPVHFQLWGTDYDRNGSTPIALAQHAANPNMTIWAATTPADWEATHARFKSRVLEVGNPSQKIMAADGTRYLAGGLLDFDPNPVPGLFGSFTSSGAWWFGATEYGVKTPSLNWSDRSLSSSQYPPGKGLNLQLSYRHGPQRGAGLSGTCQQNKGAINALFFDGSVRRLNDKASRNPVFWYPKGTKVNKANEGMIDDLPNGSLVP